MVLQPNYFDQPTTERRIHQLSQFYSEKHNEQILPYIYFNDSIALIAAVASAIFFELTGMMAVLFGIGFFGLVLGLGRWILNMSDCLYINQKAAAAVISPGFFHWALEQSPVNLSSADRIVQAHTNYVISAN